MGPVSWRPRLSARAISCIATAAPAVALFLAAPAVPAQELEPRAYSASPVGTNFAVAGLSRVKGEVLLDPSVPIKDLQADINLFVAGYLRTFELAGHTASAGIVVPYARMDASGQVFDAPREVYRAGVGDVRLRLAVNLLGNPPVSPQEFARRDPGPVVGASLSLVVPTGQYVSTRLINVGTHRWSVKPELGASFPLGNWFVETSAGAWIFGDNDDFLGGQRRSQDPLYIMQVHAGYNFRPGMWLAFNAAYANGGRSTIGGVEKDDYQHNSRYGVTLAVPLSRSWSAKLAWSKGFVTRAGGDYEIAAVALQYRWFDR